MKWYNKDKTLCLNFDLIPMWDFKNGELHVYVGGTDPFRFNGEEANDIYKKLTSEREVI